MTLLLDSSLRAAMIIAVALAATSLLRRASAAKRHSLLAAAMLCAALLPLLSVVTPVWTLELPAGFQEVVPALSNIDTAPAADVVSHLANTRGHRPRLQNTGEKWGLTPLAERAPIEAMESCCAARVRTHFFVWIWASGATFTLLALVAGWLRLVWIARRAGPVSDGTWIRCAQQVGREYGFRRSIRLLQSRHPSMLATWGVLRPKVVLPGGADGWHEDRIHVVLRHELAHIQRYDWLIQMLSEFLRAAYWFNPLIWIACARLRRESEHAADDTVLNAGILGSDYAAHLLDLARAFRKPRYAWSPALRMAHQSTLEQRFRALLNPNLNRRSLTRLTIMTAAFSFLAISLPIAALRVSAERVLSLDLPFQVLSSPLGAATQSVLPIPTQSASLEGFVVRLDNGEPLPDAHVELNTPQGRGNGRATTTGPNGQFVFHDVAPGDYQLVAAREGGFLPSAYGQRSLTGRGLTITLAAGQKMTKVRLAMAQPGSISGRVMDRDGEPAGRAQVQALRTVYIDGRRSESIIASVATDDRGEYRLYWLPPGQYRVSATPQDIRRGWVPVIPKTLDGTVTYFTLFSPPVITRRVLESGEVQEEIQVPAYYPGTTDIDQASVVDVRAGENVNAVDITVVPAARAHRVRGVLIDGTTGQPVSTGSVSLVSLANSAAPMMSRSEGNGTFEISGLLPGQYIAMATAGLNQTGNSLAASLPITVGNNDVENVSIVLANGVDIPVKVTVEGPSAKGGVTLRLSSVPAASMFAGMMMPMRPGSPQHNLLTTSAFTLEGLQRGDYRFSFAAMGGSGPGELPVYVKSIRMGAADVLNSLLHVDGAVQAPLEIVLSTNIGTLEGTAVNGTGDPALNVSVALIPDPPYRTRMDLYKGTTTDASGRFQISGIAPGNYRVFTWEAVEGWPWQDPEWLRPYEGRGRPVHIEENGKEKVQLTLIR